MISPNKRIGGSASVIDRASEKQELTANYADDADGFPVRGFLDQEPNSRNPVNPVQKNHRFAVFASMVAAVTPSGAGATTTSIPVARPLNWAGCPLTVIFVAGVTLNSLAACVA